MRIADMNWMQVEEYLARDDRAVLPLGSTEQHAYLSLSTDSILAERVAIEAAEPVGKALRDRLGAGNFAGLYQRDGAEMLSVWSVAVEETRDVIETGWA